MEYTFREQACTRSFYIGLASAEAQKPQYFLKINSKKSFICTLKIDFCHYDECHYDECHYDELNYDEFHSDEFTYDECHYAECHYAQCHYAECHYA